VKKKENIMEEKGFFGRCEYLVSDNFIPDRFYFGWILL
jgi:hypothetical protein